MEQAAGPAAASDDSNRPRFFGKFTAAGPNQDGTIVVVVYETMDGQQVELGCDAAQLGDAILAFQKAVAQARDRRRVRGVRR